MGLNVGVLGAEQLAGALNGDVLHHVHAVAAAVVSLGGVALGVFIGQHRANGHHHGLGDHVLGSDELQTVSLAVQLGVNGGGNGGVKLGKVLIHFLDHGCLPSFCTKYIIISLYGFFVQKQAMKYTKFKTFLKIF